MSTVSRVYEVRESDRIPGESCQHFWAGGGGGFRQGGPQLGGVGRVTVPAQSNHYPSSSQADFDTTTIKHSFQLSVLNIGNANQPKGIFL